MKLRSQDTGKLVHAKPTTDEQFEVKRIHTVLEICSMHVIFHVFACDEERWRSVLSLRSLLFESIYLDIMLEL